MNIVVSWPQASFVKLTEHPFAMANSDSVFSDTASSVSESMMSSGIPSPPLSPRPSSVRSDAVEVSSQGSHTTQTVFLILRYVSGEKVAPSAENESDSEHTAGLKCSIDASMGQVQSRIEKYMKVSKDWFVRRRLVVGGRTYDFTDPYLKFMNTLDVVKNLTFSHERDAYILDATLLVLS